MQLFFCLFEGQTLVRIGGLRAIIGLDQLIETVLVGAIALQDIVRNSAFESTVHVFNLVLVFHVESKLLILDLRQVLVLD